ncbi:MAG: sugar transferase [Candidatus Saganbacteria bacterium]|nr:sugar transferase [Candidatus Saganbacteria bacterium]
MANSNMIKSAVKRTIDIAIGVFGLIICLPTMIAVALVIKFDSPGPVIFTQERIGRNGKKFRMFKFRSMVHDAEQILKNNKHLNNLYKNEYKLKTDPRITKIGRFIRSHSFDELPQIFNVLKGDMSLVGPRPISEGELIKYGKDLEKFLAVKPGITGLWQVSGRNDLPYDERIRLDIKYAETWSNLEDIKILFETVPVVFSGNGAY